MPIRITQLKPWQWCVVALGVVAVAGGAFLLLRVISITEMIDRIGALGPTPFFFALAILPAIGAPTTPFYLLAGATFGTGVAIPLVVGAISTNAALSYVMARWIVRPLAVKLVKRLGYEIPVVRPEDRWNVTVLVRITPGPPFPVQSYLLGLAGVPFGIYMVVTVPITSMFAVGMTVFGESLMHGSSGLLVLAVSMLVAAVLAVRLVRRMVQRRAARNGPTPATESQES